MDEAKRRELTRFASAIRIATLRQFKARGFGHIGGCLSAADALAVLYGGAMRVDPRRPDLEDRDYFVLSKGHAGPALYAALALRGYFPEEELDTLNQNGTRLPSHCDRLKTPGVDMSTGSLGQGMASAAGIALANKVLGRRSYTYAMVGDGECCEGQIWETALFAARQALDRFIVLVDYNRQQLDGGLEEVSGMRDIDKKFASFGWYVRNVDGHDVGALYDAVTAAKAAPGVPKALILHTVKGKGVPAYEGAQNNHHVTVTAQAMDEAIALLRRRMEEAPL